MPFTPILVIAFQHTSGTRGNPRENLHPKDPTHQETFGQGKRRPRGTQGNQRVFPPQAPEGHNNNRKLSSLSVGTRGDKCI